jgi:hypothetical protein
MSGRTRTALLSAALCLLAVALFDAAAFALVSQRLAVRFYPYRCTSCVPPPGEDVGDDDAPGYYAPDPELGFDIAPSRAGMSAYVDGVLYPIWSDSLRCFDTEHADLRRYVYLTGDSFTWGFTPFADKYGTILERDLGVPVLKCGLTHSGQRAQLAKMRRTIAATGSRPALIVVGYYANDIANDLTYPHTTVRAGWLVDRAVVLRHRDGIEVVRRSDADLEALLAAARADEGQGRPGLIERLLFDVERYSLSLNIVHGLVGRAAEALTEARAGPAGTPVEGIYRPSLWEKRGRFWYTDNPYAEPNRLALHELKRYADELGTPLLLALIPPKQHYGQPSYYDELKRELDADRITYVDLAASFARGGLPWWDLYWPLDQHLSPGGNRAVAAALEPKMRALLSPEAARP